MRLVVHGDLDLASGERLRSVAEPVLAQEPPRLVVDLQRLALLDASGIPVLEHLDALARRVEVPFAIAVLRNHPARRTLADAGALARLPTC